MKAAVLHQAGHAPVFEDFPDPVPQNGELLLTVKAASVKNIDKMRAAGTHYASYTQLPAVVGLDGVGLLGDGRRVYAQGLTGTIAEKALIGSNSFTLLPDTIDDITAAALPNAVIGATMALRYRAQLQKGETILINGATGVTGRLAVQIAKHDGAGRIIVTGRNPETLALLKSLGADDVLLLTDETSFIRQLKALNEASPVNVVLDYLWGRPAEWIISVLKGGGLHHVSQRVRFVTAGNMAGEHLSLGSGTLRSSAIELLGSGIGSLSPEAMQEFRSAVLPEMFALAAAKKLVMETETEPLRNISAAWHKDVAPGKRLVIEI